MSQNPFSQWYGFLPEGAIRMGRRSKEPEKLEEKKEPSKTGETECGTCAVLSSTLLVRNTTENDVASLVVYGGDLNPRAPEKNERAVLLERMFGAIGLSDSRVAFAKISNSERCGESGFCKDQVLFEIRRLQPKTVLALGLNSARQVTGTFQEEMTLFRRQNTRSLIGGARLICTHDPSHLLKFPQAKREAWEDLKTLASEMGLA